MIAIVEAHDEGALAGLYAGGWAPAREIVESVAAILADVRARGDDAVVAYTRRFDDPNATQASLRVAIPSLAEAESLVPEEIARGLRLARERIAAFHERQRATEIELRDADGTRNALLIRPFGAIGAYVPGGSAVLPSSVLMTTVPAKIASVPRVVVTSPPRRDGTTHPAILFACALCEVDELYAVGGAQAIAALAYGTQTIAAVDKVVGPGNVYVAAAKRRVFGVVGIDMIAGPSEVVILADRGADPRFVAADLLAQAEHDEAAQSILITDDGGLARAVESEVDRQLADLPRAETAGASWRDNGAIIVCPSLESALPLVDRLAPEHLEIMTDDPEALAGRIANAGAIFLGAHTPEAIGDYVGGSNHVLPTARSARFSSGLGVLDFMKRTSLLKCDARSLEVLGPAAVTLGEAEGLEAHARSVALRLRANRP